MCTPTILVYSLFSLSPQGDFTSWCPINFTVGHKQAYIEHTTHTRGARAKRYGYEILTAAAHWKIGRKSPNNRLRATEGGTDQVSLLLTNVEMLDVRLLRLNEGECLREMTFLLSEIHAMAVSPCLLRWSAVLWVFVGSHSSSIYMRICGRICGYAAQLIGRGFHYLYG